MLSLASSPASYLEGFGPCLADVSEIACLCFGGIFDEQIRRKPLAIAADALRYGD